MMTYSAALATSREEALALGWGWVLSAFMIAYSYK